MTKRLRKTSALGVVNLGAERAARCGRDPALSDCRAPEQCAAGCQPVSCRLPVCGSGNLSDLVVCRKSRVARMFPSIRRRSSLLYARSVM